MCQGHYWVFVIVIVIPDTLVTLVTLFEKACRVPRYSRTSVENRESRIGNETFAKAAKL